MLAYKLSLAQTSLQCLCGLLDTWFVPGQFMAGVRCGNKRAMVQQGIESWQEEWFHFAIRRSKESEHGTCGVQENKEVIMH